MWWLRLATPLIVAAGLAACGYTPLYGTSSAGMQTSEALSDVAIAPIDMGLVGLDVYTGLLDRINPEGSKAGSKHRLQVRLAPALSGLLVQPDSAITRYNYTLIGSYELIDLSTGKVAVSGDVVGTSAYNVVSSEYATVVARRDAEKRAAKSVSDEIALRIALYLKTRPS